MYKDKSLQREAVKKAVQKHRKGITSEGITGQGITRIEFIQRELGEDLTGRIERTLAYSLPERHENREERYEKAYRYKLWRDNRRWTVCL